MQYEKQNKKIKLISEVLETTLRPCLIKLKENAEINKLSGNKCIIYLIHTLIHK